MKKTITEKIKETLVLKGGMAEICYYGAINLLNSTLETKTDEEVRQMFGATIHPEAMRETTKYIYDTLQSDL